MNPNEILEDILKKIQISSERQIKIKKESETLH